MYTPKNKMKGGKRLLFITIDGDGFIYKTNHDNRCVGEVFLNEIIKTYPFLFTASISVGDIFKYPDKFDIELIKRIFKLDNVEAASHGWDHPHNWQTRGVDIKREIIDSVNFINKYLLTSSKKVKIFLWTGLCNPSEECLKIVESLGIENLNDFRDKNKPFKKVGKYFHFMSRADMDFTYMDIENIKAKHKLSSYQNAFYLGNVCLNGFKKVVKYYESNPGLPVHLWIHWYSAVRKESLNALKYVLDWCLIHELKPVFASEYIKGIRRNDIKK